MNRLISLLIYGTIITTKIRIKSVRNCAKQARRVAFLSKQILLSVPFRSERITWQKVFRTFPKLFFFLFKGRVAQRIRARGYEPRSRGFKSLLAQQKANCMVFYSFSFFHLFCSVSQNILFCPFEKKALVYKVFSAERKEE